MSRYTKRSADWLKINKDSGIQFELFFEDLDSTPKHIFRRRKHANNK